MNRLAIVAIFVAFMGTALPTVEAQRPRPAFPPYAAVIKGYEKVVSTAPDGKPSLFTIWVRKKDGQMLAELPGNYARNRYFIALTIASGDLLAGLQWGDLYVYLRRYDRRLAFVAPNTDTRSTGDAESRSSVRRLFTDRVLIDVPILTIGARGGPVIDMDALLVGQAGRFFGPRGAPASRSLVTIKKAKAFPQNVELAFEVPVRGGVLKTLHYSISNIPNRTGYQPRLADQRIGYFTTAYRDLGDFRKHDTWNRYINRWHLEKRDPSLKLSPPKQAIVFYIEHTTPVRYRRWVRDGVLRWNKAFEKVGLDNAIVVHQQDASSGEHMDKDPEDVRYNFVRWLNNDIGIAIGPSRIHPVTGQILDADIIMTDGWIRSFLRSYREELPAVACEGFDAETLAWLQQRPRWDPRIRLAPPEDRPRLLAQGQSEAFRPHAGHPLGNADPEFLGDDEFDGLTGRASQVNGMCLAATGKAFDLAVLRTHLDVMEKKGGEKPDLLDGIPENYMGPLVADLIAHEVGHTLGLRHNFKASSIYSLDKINSEDRKGKPFAGSTMDYLPVNINMEDGSIQGDYAMTSIGPYDEWAIEYGYSFAKDLKPILARVAEPELAYATDENTFGSDPLARRYDFGSDPLQYAKSRVKLAKHHRSKLLDSFVKDGESWAKARRGYQMTLIMQVRALSMMANWVGGAFIHRDHKGDKNARSPIVVVDAERQRKALNFVLKNTFHDEAFGITPELLKHMSLDKWLDGGGFFTAFQDTPWPVHDRVMAIQSAVLTMLMNPSTLKRVYDNELRTPTDQDMITLPELLDQIAGSIWNELDGEPDKTYTARQPWISSLRRNLQREHLERLIDLTLPEAGFGAAYKPISNLTFSQLRKLQKKMQAAFANAEKIDAYSMTHLSEASLRIDKAIEAEYVYNVADLRGGGFGGLFFKESIERLLAENQRVTAELQAELQAELERLNAEREIERLNAIPAQEPVSDDNGN